MSHDRRMLSRRRRVISAQTQSPDVIRERLPKQAASESAARSGATYGARVHRRLRARWFELVPVRRRSLLAVKLFLLASAAGLILGHWLSMHWSVIANSPQLARPLRLDHPASFGGWFGSLAITFSAATGFLIYQLRRYRADDYHGQYRIWRPVIVMLLVLSVDSIAGLVDWSGAVLDHILAGRAPMAGADWLRLLLCIAGFGLTIRLLIEMWRSPVAASWIVFGALSVSSPLLIRWSLIDVAPQTAAMVAGAGPLLGRIAIFLSLLTYLRTIHREARGLDSAAGVSQRIRLPRFGRWRPEEQDEELDTAPKTPRKTKTRSSNSQPDAQPEPASASAANVADPESGATESEPEKKRRSWFSRKRDTTPAETPADEPTTGSRPASEQVKSERAESKANEPKANEPKTSQADEDESDSGHDEQDGTRERKKWGVFGFGSRRGASKPIENQTLDEPLIDDQGETDDWDDDAQSESNRSGDESAMNVDNIDWETMSKSERRRMKKLLRRQGNDAA